MYTDLGRPGIHLWLRATEQSSFSFTTCEGTSILCKGVWGAICQVDILFDKIEFRKSEDITVYLQKLCDGCL